MHKQIRLLILCSTILLISCSPTIHYLGDSYPAKEKVEVFYDENDIEKKYKVIGQMTNDKILNYELDSIKEKMIKKAKEKGADAIVFVNFWVEDDPNGIVDKTSINAKLIQYVE